MKHTITRMLVGGAVAGSVLWTGTAAAIEWNVTGFVRQEIAYSLAETNPNNRMGNKFNGRITPHLTHASFGDGSNALAPAASYVDARGNIGGLNGASFGLATHGAGANTSNAVDCHYNMQRALAAGNPGFGNRVMQGTAGGVIFPSAFGGGVGGGVVCPGGVGSVPPGDIGDLNDDDLNFNAFNSRLEVDVQAKISKEFSAYMKVRAYYDGTRNFTDGEIGDHFGSQMWGSRGTLTEWNSSDAIIDIPALYLDWNRGPLWVRLGNQTIAWGEAYFFRTMDVANGLDLRRHLTLGPGAEEYQDQRIASPGIRVSYTFDNGWELDAFAQMFSPTILPAQNTPYNLVATNAAILDDEDGFDDAEGSINFGARLTMPLTDAFTGIIAYVNRRNPDGAFTNTDAPTHWKGAVNGGCLNAFNDTLNFLGGSFGTTTIGATNAVLGTGVGSNGRAVDPFPVLDTRARNMNRGCGSALAPDPTGTPSLQYWDQVQQARIDNGNYLRQIINEFPASEWAVRDIFGFGDETNFVETYRTLEGFRSSFGPYVQWIGRQFKRESIFMAGGNYIITMDDPNSIFDQMIVRGEVAVTPNKRITNDLSYSFKEVDDVVSALILEKYHRISDSFPATYFVAQWMHRTSTDLFGRDLDKADMPGLDEFVDPVTGNFLPAAFVPGAMAPRGTSSANYVVFAFQQPFPNLIWRFDMSVLVDVAGGYLVQPGLRFRPSANWQWDMYATIIESPGGDNDTITETLDWADEFFVRLTYYF